jgi:hypothetical protein
MKDITIILFALICSIAMQAQDFVEFTVSESTNPNYEIITSNDTMVEFNVVVPGMFETVIDTFNRVNIAEHTVMDSVGFPEMPVISFLIAIPACDSVNLNISLLDSVQYTGYNVYPAPELVPDTTSGGAIALVEEFAYDTSVYNTDAMFPGNVGEAIGK